MYYQALRKTLNSKPVFINESDDVSSHINDKDVDWYSSLYGYTEEQKKLIEQHDTVSVIKDTLTNRLFFDLDSESNISLAQQDSINLINKLISLGIPKEAIQPYFSGLKGFSIEVLLKERTLNPTAFKSLLFKLAKDFKTLDMKVSDANRVIRIPNTKHQKSGLYKIPLRKNELLLPIEQIKELAKTTRLFSYDNIRIDLPQPIKTLLAKEEKKEVSTEIDFKNKAPQWRNCKWALLQGEFGRGLRSDACATIAATCKGLGYDRETTRHMCLSALEKSWAKYGKGDFDENELEETCLSSIFSDHWNGGSYTCTKPGWLKQYCDSLGVHKCQSQEEEAPCVQLQDISSGFIDFATNLEYNIIKTGIDQLDENGMFLTYTLNGILGAPGAGKTSLALQYLNTASRNNIPSVFLSLDMGEPIVFAKLIQKFTGLPFKEVLKVFKENPLLRTKYMNIIQEQYKNVGFNFKSGLTVESIKKIVENQTLVTGRKTKLLVIDYLECIAGPYSESLANTGFIANQLKNLSNDLGICIILLLQTQKHSTPDISDPLLSMRNIKGSSVLEQSMSVVVTLWREGYNPKTIVDDRSISFAIVKNRFGSLWQDDFRWEGVTGNISELAEEEREALKEFKEKKKANRGPNAGTLFNPVG